MRKNLFWRKAKLFNLGERRFVMVVLLATIIFVLGAAPFIEAKKINDGDLEKIENFLEISNFPFFSDYTTKQLKKVLNEEIWPTEGLDLTYGALILGNVSEMELIDLVISGRYVEEARKYFNHVLDKHLDLTKHWKGVAQKFYSVLKKGKSATPLTVLGTESVSMIDKTITIVVETQVWMKSEMHDGLFRYFYDRMKDVIHEVAWSDALVDMGRAQKIEIRNNDLFVMGRESNKEVDAKLEVQFAALWDKWGEYATSNGISEEYKEQLASELRDAFAVALEAHNFAEEEKGEEKEPSWLVQQIEEMGNLVATIKENVQSVLSEINPFDAGPPVDPPEATETEEVGEVEPLPAEVESGPGLGPSLDEIQEDLDDILEEFDIISEDTSEILPEESVEEVSEAELQSIEGPESELKIEAEPESESELEPEPEPEPELAEDNLSLIEEEEFSQICKWQGDAPKRFRVFINEVAWMGTENSADDEWIELKNIWGVPINLSGWQLLDKDGRIKVIFGEEDIIPAGGYYLLERTDDDSLPDVPADKIYTGALSNTDEALYLFDNDCQLEDKVEANPNWPGGDNALKKPMQRFDSFYWYAGFSTPGNENSPAPAIYSHPSGSASAPEASPSSSPIYPEILITETYIGNPGHQKNDFVELYNPNSEDINLTDWYLQRKTASAQDFYSYVPNTLLVGKTIQAQNYFLIANASSTFATSADVVTTYSLTENNTLVLKNPNRDIVGQVSTDEPPVSKSYGREWSSVTQNYLDNFEIQIPTPRAQNQSLEGEEGEDGDEENEEDEEGEETGVELLSVVINEIAWAGTVANATDEWIELYNNSTSTIDLTGWQLSSPDGSPDISFGTSSIGAQDFYLIERTGDDTVNDIPADWLGSFGYGLSNTDCEVLSLYDNNENLIDQTACSESNWPGGEANPNYISMERIDSQVLGSDSNNWASNNRITRNGQDANGNSINGTPKAENSVSKSETQISFLPFDEFPEITLTYLGNPYIVGTLTIPEGKTLKIEPEVVLKFQELYYWGGQDSLVVKGTLLAQGREGKEVVFTSLKTPQGDDNWWNRIYFASSSQNSILENCQIRYGGKKQNQAYAIFIDSTSIEMKNCLLENFNQSGIKLVDSSSTIENLTIQNAFSGEAALISGGKPIIKNSSFKNTWAGISIEEGSTALFEANNFEGIKYPLGPILVKDSYPVFENNIAKNNTLNGIFLSGSVNRDWILTKDLPYLITNLKVVENTTLTIEPGVIIKFLTDGKLEIDGTLKTDSIVFTSFLDDEFWNQIFFSTSSQNSILENSTISYGGKTGKGAIYVKESKVELRNNTLKNNGPGYYSLYIENSPSSIVEDSAFENCNIAIGIVGACPQIQNLNFNNCRYTYYRKFDTTDIISTSTNPLTVCSP